MRATLGGRVRHSGLTVDDRRSAPASDQLTKTRQSDHVARPRLQIYRSAPRLYLAGLRSLPSSPHVSTMDWIAARLLTATLIPPTDFWDEFFLFSTADFFITVDSIQWNHDCRVFFFFFFFKSRYTYESYYIRSGWRVLSRDKIVKLRSKNFS